MLDSAPNRWSPVEAAHLLQRAGFSGTIKEISDLHALGRHNAVERLLELAADSPLPSLPEWSQRNVAIEKIGQYLRQRRDLLRRRDSHPAESDAYKTEHENLRQLNRRHRAEKRGHMLQGIHWWLQQMINSPGGLREQLTLFWHDHFATGFDKVSSPALMMWQNQLLRQHSSGNFRALTHAIARDPAMMIYLDIPRSSKQHPNENFAREIMELFVLGEGNYQEADILELARALTGLTLDRRTMNSGFNKNRHDDTKKTIFGQQQNYNPTHAIEHVLNQPATAPHIAGKLWQWFAGDPPSDQLREQLGAELQRHNFHIRPFLRTLFRSHAFYHSSVIGRRIKSPIQLLVSFCRQFGIQSIPASYAAGALARMGQLPFQPPNVAGWEGGRSWINGDSLLARYNIIGELLRPGFRGPRVNGPSANTLQLRNQHQAMSDWQGPEWRNFLPVESRTNPAQTLELISFALLGARLDPPHRQNITDWLERHQDITLDNDQILELVELICCSPPYQLG